MKRFRIAVFMGCWLVACCSSTMALAQEEGNIVTTNSAIDWWVNVLIPLLQMLLWPIAILVALIILRPQLAGLTKRMQHVKVKTPMGEMEIVGTDNPKEAEVIAQTASRVMRISSENTRDFAAQVEEQEGKPPEVLGNPDQFQTLFKVSSDRLMKSTKAMNIPNGCILQVTSREIDQNGQIDVAEAVTFVPDVNVRIENDEEGNIVKAEFVKIDSPSRLK